MSNIKLTKTKFLNILPFLTMGSFLLVLIVAFLLRQGVIGNQEVNSLNVEIVNAINARSSDQLNHLYSADYINSKDIFTDIGEQKCIRIEVNKIVNSTNVHLQYNGEDIGFEYSGKLVCEENSFFISVKTNEEGQIIYLNLD